MNTGFHVPVLLGEVVSWLRPRAHGCYLDSTIGLAGTAERILEASDPDGMLVGIDRDPTAVAYAETKLRAYKSRVKLFCENFQNVQSVLHAANVKQVDGMVFDLGVSSAQLAQPERGFSFQQDGPLDMRMNPTQGLSAAHLVNTLSETRLAHLIYTFGEERHSRRIARAIVSARTHAPLRTTTELSHVIQQAVPGAYRYGRLHPATRTFQAFRLAVNDELDALQTVLTHVPHLLAPGARACVISFHSLEDRIVKQSFRGLAQDAPDQWAVLTKKPVVPSPEERQTNPRARSAKLRVLERLPRTGATSVTRGHA